MNTIAYVITYRSPLTGIAIVNRGVSRGTDSHATQARRVRARVYIDAGLHTLPAIRWSRVSHWHAQSIASRLREPVVVEPQRCDHESETTADGHGAYCRICGETIA